MKYVLYILVLLLIATNLYAKTDSKKQLKDGNKILSKSDDKIDVSAALVEFDMKVYRKNKLQRTYKMTAKSSGTEKNLIEFTHPPRNKGEKILRVGDNIWMYRPKINRVMRVSGRSNSVGSDFSNTDLFFIRLDRDYTSKLLGIEKYNGEKAYKLELLAKSEDVTYAKIIYWVRVKDYMPLKREHYTLSGHKLKTLVLETTTNALKGIPDTFTMTNVMEEEKKSILRLTHLETKRDFPDRIFRKDSLKRKR